MKLIDRHEARQSLGECAEKVGNEPVIVTRNGKPIAALLPIGDSDWETISLSLNPEFIGIIQRSRARHEAEGGVSSDEMRRRLGLSGRKSNGHLLRPKPSKKTKKRRS
jgi:prevent-host-death family protein